MISMAPESFDPYSAYLGLPDGERPPHYYDLLEIELFCSHHERIHQAVRKQFRIIKRFHDHHDRDTREAIQDIMTAITTARVVLTDPQQKEAYDVDLARRLNIDRDRYLAAHVAAPLPEFEIMIIAGPTLVRSRFDLIEGTPFTIGSDTHNLLTLDPGRVPGRQCVIDHVDGEWVVKPTPPAKVVHVNDRDTNETALASGDRIDVGGYRLLFSAFDQKDPLNAARAAGPPPLSLIIQKGPSIPTPVFNVLPLQRMIVGQGVAALWQLPDQTVSHSHCAIQSVGDRWEIEDLETTNGTRVNGVEVMRRLLNDRDVITLGRFDILVSLRF